MRRASGKKRKKKKYRTQEIEGQKVLAGEKGKKFFHKHLSDRSRRKKRSRRQMRKQSRRR